MEDFRNLDGNFLKEWLKYGDEMKEEPYQFISYYIAFNFLYNKHKRTWHDQQKESEFNQIKNFIQHHYFNNAEIKIDFKSLLNMLGEDSEYLKKNVESERADFKDNKDEEDVKKGSGNKGISKQSADKETIKKGRLYRDCEKNAVYELFYAIYLVRCNLFHGNKQLIGDQKRNVGLLKDGSKILRELLDMYQKG